MLYEVITENGADLERADSRGRTPLILAASLGRGELIGPLLERGAKVDARGADGKTALHFAAAAGAGEIAMRLLEAGADRSYNFV